jgi:hypothetical protein
MSPEQKKWFKKLKKCLEDMPLNTEISVCTVAATTSDIYIHNSGDVDSYEIKNEDRWCSSFENISLDGFRASRVIANSECI